MLIKPNQVGTVSETLDAVRLTHDAGWQTMVSHRSGETTDGFIADFAVAVGADYLKAGAPARVSPSTTGSWRSKPNWARLPGLQSGVIGRHEVSGNIVQRPGPQRA